MINSMMFLTEYKVKTSACKYWQHFFLKYRWITKQPAMTGNISKFDSIFLLVFVFFFFFAFPKLTIYWGKTVLLNLFPYLKDNASHDNSEL